MKRRILLWAAVLGLSCSAALAFDTRPTPDHADGTPAQIDLPTSQHLQNVGGSDGAGLCVYSAVTMGARWQNVKEMYGLRKFAEGRPGGSYPQKLAADLKTYAERNKIKLPGYVQHTGGDETFLDLCVQTRRSPGITYAGLDDFYGSGIAHMVNLAHLDSKRGAIIDNNRAGNWTWAANRTQLVNRWKGLDDKGGAILVPVRQGIRIVWTPVGGGWAFVWLAPPPPPKPATVADQFAPVPPADKFSWERKIIDGAAYWFCFADGVPVFAVDSKGNWHVALGEEDFDPAVIDPPEGVGAPNQPEPTADWNNGVEFWRVSPQHRYWIGGVEVSRAKAFAALLEPGESGLVDDSDKYHLTVVTAEKDAVYKEFLPGGKLEKYGKRIHLQVYEPTDWPAKDRLSTVVTLQEPAKVGGKIVGSANDVSGVAKVLGDVFDAPAVPPDPKPAPNKPADPDPKPAPPDAPKSPGWLKALLAGLIAWLVAKGIIKG